MFNLSVLSPLKITNEKQFSLFCECLETYKDIIVSDSTELIIVNESPKEFKNKVNDKLISIKPSLIDLDQKGFVNSVRGLIDKSKGKYIMFFLDDVEMVYNSKKICDSVIDCMIKNQKIFQVKIGGGKVSNTPKSKNLKKFSNTHKKLSINESFSIWLNKNTEEYKNNNYVITHWNCITRGDLLRDFNNRLKTNTPTWDGLTLAFSNTFKEDIKNYYTGWLNLQSFIYPWGRTKYNKKEWIQLTES